MVPLGKLVESQFEKPNLGATLVFFALPFALQLFFSFMFGSSVDFASFLLHALAPALISWIVSSIILYVLLLGFKGRAANGKLGSVFSALSVYNLVYFAGLLALSVVMFFGVPQLFAQKGLSAVEQFSAVYAIASNPQLIHWIVLIAGFLIGLCIAFSYLYIAAKIAKLTKETGRFSDSLLAVMFAVLSVVAFLLISGIFSGI